MFFSPVRGRYLVIYSYTDSQLTICEFEIYGTFSEWPGKIHFFHKLDEIANNADIGVRGFTT